MFGKHRKESYSWISHFGSMARNDFEDAFLPRHGKVQEIPIMRANEPLTALSQKGCWNVVTRLN